ncbi:DNA-binding transcriptional LysR family regulator [Geothermobacter ehrlichii]|uniref:DNA-binding transcriptional LysR family regulator n=1 Tax=Geothermobacter ehrlichii TaxID=213224 RepID=A0A5D3WN48_9BACT|nr:substrate-binding domain-containing protein [Geothermobacter ehrlichii]TYO98755.1 DNA-binding transcriptional LysR family regulator [Geothermobacter ehrlichii]
MKDQGRRQDDAQVDGEDHLAGAKGAAAENNAGNDGRAAGRGLPAIEELLEQAERLQRKAAGLRRGSGEPLHIGLNTDPGFLQVGAINRRLRHLNAEFNVIFISSETSHAPRLLRQGQLDLAFVYGRPSDPDLCCEPLAEVHFCIVIPPPLLQTRQEPDWEEVASLPWIWAEHSSLPYTAVLHEFTRRRLKPNRAVRAVDEFIVRQLVIEGQGVAVMREDEALPLADDGTVSIWSKGWLRLPLSLIWLARNEKNQLLRLAREAICELWSARPSTAESRPGGFG